MANYNRIPPSQWTEADRQSRRNDWNDACARFDEFPQTGIMPDGAAVRALGAWGLGVKERSGYVCSPIAYLARQKLGLE